MEVSEVIDLARGALGCDVSGWTDLRHGVTGRNSYWSATGGNISPRNDTKFYSKARSYDFGYGPFRRLAIKCSDGVFSGYF